MIYYNTNSPDLHNRNNADVSTFQAFSVAFDACIVFISHLIRTAWS